MRTAANNGLTLAILAAGRSQRFGDMDKLTAPLGGKMLGLHVADALAALDFAQHIIITSDENHACWTNWTHLEYDIHINEAAAQGQAMSVKMAAQHAARLQSDGLCICLADMPFVTAEHVGNLVSAFKQPGRIKPVASIGSSNPMPPAIFPKDHMPKLMTLEGDQGARALIAQAQLVHVSDSILLDIDTPEDLCAAEDKYY